MPEDRKKLYGSWVRLAMDPEDPVPDDERKFLVAIGEDNETLPLYRVVDQRGPLSTTQLTYPLSVYKWFANAIDEVKKPRLILVKSIEKRWGAIPPAPSPTNSPSTESSR